MKRLYDDEYHLTEEGKEVDVLVARRLTRMVNDLVIKKGYHPHDVERIVTGSIRYQVTMWALRDEMQRREEDE